MKRFFDDLYSTTTTHKKITFVDFIVNNGFYRDFLSFCSRYPQVKSRNKLAVMYVRHIGLFNIAKAFVYFDINKSMSFVKDVRWA